MLSSYPSLRVAADNISNCQSTVPLFPGLLEERTRHNSFAMHVSCNLVRTWVRAVCKLLFLSVDLFGLFIILSPNLFVFLNTNLSPAVCFDFYEILIRKTSWRLYFLCFKTGNLR